MLPEKLVSEVSDGWDIKANRNKNNHLKITPDSSGDGAGLKQVILPPPAFTTNPQGYLVLAQEIQEVSSPKGQGEQWGGVTLSPWGLVFIKQDGPSTSLLWKVF